MRALLQLASSHEPFRRALRAEVQALRQAAVSHYPIDRGHVRRTTHRNRRQEVEEAKEHGFFTYRVAVVLPLGRIKPEPVWNEARITRIRKAIEQGKPLPPIRVTEVGGRYEITDGIHRYNASREVGFTHIPVYLDRVVQAPELYEEPEPEKRKLDEGQWVRFRETAKGTHRFDWGFVEEYVGTRTHKGVRRHVYGLVGGDSHKAEWLGDFTDEEFDAVAELAVPVRVRESVARERIIG